MEATWLCKPNASVYIRYVRRSLVATVSCRFQGYVGENKIAEKKLN